MPAAADLYAARFRGLRVRDDGGHAHAAGARLAPRRHFRRRRAPPPPTEEGWVFVDRDGEQFQHVLNWLRDGDVAALAEAEYQQLLREAEYYRMHGLIDYINERIREEKVDSSSEAELTRKDVIKCIQADKVRFRGVNLSGLDLSKPDLWEVDFSCRCIKKTDFSRANLHKAKFGEVEASHSSFHYANLRECEFVGANLEESTLDRANLQSAILQECKPYRCQLERS